LETTHAKIGIDYEKSHIYFFFQTHIKNKKNKKKPEIKWVVGHPQSISRVALKCDGVVAPPPNALVP
jgi:hypothetical protein